MVAVLQVEQTLNMPLMISNLAASITSLLADFVSKDPEDLNPNLRFIGYL